MLLIVDDNKQMRRMIRSLVEDLDAEIYECADGAEALASCRVRQPDWIFMDVQMKPMDGLTATREIKAIFPQMKICIVTDHADEKTRRAAMEAGAGWFCGKEDLMCLRDFISSN